MIIDVNADYDDDDDGDDADDFVMRMMMRIDVQQHVPLLHVAGHRNFLPAHANHSGLRPCNDD